MFTTVSVSFTVLIVCWKLMFESHAEHRSTHVPWFWICLWCHWHADHLQAHQAASTCAPPSSLKAKYTCTHVCKIDIGVMSLNFESDNMWLGRRVVASLSAGQWGRKGIWNIASSISSNLDTVCLFNTATMPLPDWRNNNAANIIRVKTKRTVLSWRTVMLNTWYNRTSFIFHHQSGSSTFWRYFAASVRVKRSNKIKQKNFTLQHITYYLPMYDQVLQLWHHKPTFIWSSF